MSESMVVVTILILIAAVALSEIAAAVLPTLMLIAFVSPEERRDLAILLHTIRRRSTCLRTLAATRAAPRRQRGSRRPRNRAGRGGGRP